MNVFGVELLYGVQSTLVAVLRYTALLTALLYAITKRVDASSSRTEGVRPSHRR